MLSLLYEQKEEPQIMDFLEDLLIDKTVSAIFPSSNDSQYILSILKQPLQNQDNIIFRQEVCQDFLANNELLKELSSVFKRYDQLKDEWERSRSRLKTINNPTQLNETSLDMIRDIIYTLELNAQYCLKITSVPQVLRDIFKKYRVNSTGLLRIKELCEAHLKDDRYIRLRQVAKKLSKIPFDSGCFEISVDFSDSLHLYSTHLSRTHQESDNLTTKSLLSSLLNIRKEKTDQDESASLSVSGKTTRELVSVIAESLVEVSTLLANITRTIYPDFLGISQDFLFYSFAIKLHHIYIEEQIDVSFPDIRPEAEDIFDCKDLRDLFLVTKDYYSKRPTKNIVPNDVLLSKSKKGVLIKGNNDSGKTTFLRSIGAAQVLAQAGLSIPAKRAKISTRRNILTQFSKNEEELIADDVSGRFESEVKEIAAIMDKLEPYSLLLLNETFQTTAFDESAQSLFDILDVISEVNVKWVFVTHILQLYEMFYNIKKEILYLQMSKEQQYKLEQVDCV